MLRSLRGRMLLSSLSLLMIALIVLGFVLAGRAWRDASRGLEERLALEGRALAAGGSPLLDLAEPGPSLQALAGEVVSPDTEVIVVRPDGVVLHASPTVSEAPSLKAPEVQAALAGHSATAVRPDPDTGVSELHFAVPIVEEGAVVGLVLTAAPRDELGAAVRRVVMPIVVVGAVAAAATLALSFALTIPLVGSLGRLSAVARQLAAGYLYERAERPGIVEAEELSEAINHMASSLEQRVRDGFQQRDTFGAVIDTMADALLVTDEHGAVDLVNPAAARLFDLDPTEAIGKTFIEIVRDHEIAEVLQKTLASGHAQTGEVGVGSDQRLLRVVATPIERRDHPSVLVIIQDLTEIQRLEGMRREFVANVSHELRTPLASIKAATEVLQGGAMKKKAMADEFLGRVNAEVDNLTQLIQRLTDLSRVESGKAGLVMEPLDIGQAVGGVVDRLRPQAERQEISLDMEFPPDVPKVHADPVAVDEVLLNLVGNAIKYTPLQGSIRVTARLSEEMVEVTVEDTGEGVHPDHLPHIFERFYKADRSRASEGLGLGLALARHLVQAHGGRIWAESTLGKGSAFHFTVPQAPQKRRRP